MVYIQFIRMTTCRRICVESEEITNFQFDNTKYNFIAHIQITMNSTKLQSGQE